MTLYQTDSMLKYDPDPLLLLMKSWQKEMYVAILLVGGVLVFFGARAVYGPQEYRLGGFIMSLIGVSLIWIGNTKLRDSPKIGAGFILIIMTLYILGVISSPAENLYGKGDNTSIEINTN